MSENSKTKLQQENDELKARIAELEEQAKATPKRRPAKNDKWNEYINPPPDIDTCHILVFLNWRLHELRDVLDQRYAKNPKMKAAYEQEILETEEQFIRTYRDIEKVSPDELTELPAEVKKLYTILKSPVDKRVTQRTALLIERYGQDNVKIPS